MGNESTHRELVRQLSAEDKAALELLSHDPPKGLIASRQAYRLLQLGLAELNCGRLILTVAGITALAVAREL